MTITKTYQLFMGRDIPSGGVVTDRDWNAFMHEVLDEYFDGYTVSDVDGVWKGTHESTKCVSICTHKVEYVRAVAQAYKDLFAQDSVALQVLDPLQFV